MDDVVRVPPVRVAERDERKAPSAGLNRVSQLKSALSMKISSWSYSINPQVLPYMVAVVLITGRLKQRVLYPEQRFLELVNSG